MDLVVFENNKPWVIDEFREGRFDYVELASDVAETKFFQFLFGQQVVDRLRPPDLRIAWVDGRWAYVLPELGFGRSLSERTRMRGGKWKWYLS